MKHIVLSRTDSIGDVVLTLPLAGYLKSIYPEAKISFIGTKYTYPVISISKYVDHALIKEELKHGQNQIEADAIIFVFPDKEIAQWAKTSGIKTRIGTSHRWFHYLYANQRVDFSRKNSKLHEAQLNFKLLSGIGLNFIPTKQEIPNWYGLVTEEWPQGNDQINKKIILHPKSKNSAREWPLEKYFELVKGFIPQKVEFVVTGTEGEGELIKSQMPDFFRLPNILDYTGKFNLGELIHFIGEADGLVAASTGPLHISSALGKPSLGLYPPLKPIDPGRWGPLGKKASFLTSKDQCNKCPGGQTCPCMQDIPVAPVGDWINNFIQKH